MDYILSIDQGTSSTRSVVFDNQGNMVAVSQKEHKQFFPQPSWVEHDPNEIKNNVLETMSFAVEKANIGWEEIKSIGITNQRETLVAWDKKSGIPLANAIVWQCRRTSPQINKLKEEGYSDLFLKKTGLVLDAYFSGTKAKWMIDNATKVKEKVDNDLAFGTIDSWIIYFLTGEHKTDASNASRTLLFDINTKRWSDELSEILGVPIQTLPKLWKNAAEPFGYFKKDGITIPIRGVLGDQQAALFGQSAFDKGQAKTTYGTGNFSLLNIGNKPLFSSNGLLTTIAWELDGKTTYALEGSVFTTGAALKWLRDGLGILSDFSEIDNIAKTVNSSDGVVFVPAFVGLGAPHWDSTASGSIFGISGGTSKANILHATLDAIAYQTDELIKLMEIDVNLNLKEMAVDGGTTKSDILMQKQADISQIRILRPKNIETTALGAAFMAGYKLIWENLDEMRSINPVEKEYFPLQTDSKRSRWDLAVKKSREWY